MSSGFSRWSVHLLDKQRRAGGSIRTPPSQRHTKRAHTHTRSDVPMRKANTHKITYSWPGVPVGERADVFLEKHEARLIRDGPPRYICPTTVDRDCNNIKISAKSPEVHYLSPSISFPFFSPCNYLPWESEVEKSATFCFTDFYEYFH